MRKPEFAVAEACNLALLFTCQQALVRVKLSNICRILLTCGNSFRILHVHPTLGLGEKSVSRVLVSKILLPQTKSKRKCRLFEINTSARFVNLCPPAGDSDLQITVVTSQDCRGVESSTAKRYPIVSPGCHEGQGYRVATSASQAARIKS